ncbi:MAG: HlyD family type I secretion periplasmic adaptor subunit [Hyphomicrobiaceae bacterium]
MSNKSNSLGMTREELEFLPAALEVLETPPRPAARLSALTICLFFLSAVLWAIFGRVDTVAVAQGQIVPKSRVKLIQPLETAIVRAIHVQDGQFVKAGDVLIELDPTDAASNYGALRADLTKAQLDAAVTEALDSNDPDGNFQPPKDAPSILVEASKAQLHGELEKLAAVLAMQSSDLEEQEASLATYQSQLRKAQSAEPLVEERLAGLEQLNAKNLVRKPDLFATRQQKIDNASEQESARSAIAQTQSRIESRQRKIEEARASFRADVLQRRADALRRIASLEQQLKKEEQRQKDRLLRAPVDGTVLGLAIFTVGGVVSTKDVLLRIVPAESELLLEATVLNQDIGFVEVGQAVEIKLETFPFTRYGLIDGEVREVWRDAIQDEKKGLVYKAEVSLKQKDIRVGDRWVPLSPGMAAQAEIRTGDRPVIQYFLSPLLRYRSEALRER